MKSISLSLVLLGLTAPLAAAQSTPGLITTSPGGADEFCYYAGLAYSEGTSLIIEVTNRRESPEATQKANLICARDDQEGDLIWVRGRDE